MSTDELRDLYRNACKESDRYTDLLKRGCIKSTADWWNVRNARERRDELAAQLMERAS